MKVFRFYNKDLHGTLYNEVIINSIATRIPVRNIFISKTLWLSLSKKVAIEGISNFSLIKTSAFYMHLIGIISYENLTVELPYNNSLDFSKNPDLGSSCKLYLYEIDYTKTRIDNNMHPVPDIALEVMEGTVDECMLWKLTSQEPVYCFSD